MTERDDFDKIVEGLDLDFSFPDEPADPVQHPSQATPAGSSDSADEQEPFYRKVEPLPVIPRRRGIMLAWAGLLGSPAVLVLATVAHVFLSSSVIAGASLTFVASAIYLFLQLPEHGPSRKDWPDDGAVL